MLTATGPASRGQPSVSRTNRGQNFMTPTLVFASTVDPLPCLGFRAQAPKNIPDLTVCPGLIVELSITGNVRLECQGAHSIMRRYRMHRRSTDQAETLRDMNISVPYLGDCFSVPSVDTCLDATSGRLKMQDRKMTDRKMTDKSAGLENAGLENDGQKCNTQNALIDH